ncbi:MAG: staygreen family protein [Tissierellia bacterium]|nr:staygreen family protein [Tissierellia bacterium]MDD4779786.1 staygreen family protein [Tissierellia bacterium]
MSRLDPKKLHVEYVGATSTEPIIPRRYTLTHSDVTADLYLTIGLDFAYFKLNPMRDEVMGEWILNDENYFYYVYLYVDGKFIPEVKAIREAVFRRELPLAFEAIRYGDNEFFNTHQELDYVPIIVYFLSIDPMFNKVEYWGTFSDYKIVV